MKKPDEIEKGLYSIDETKNILLIRTGIIHDRDKLYRSALAYIQQLERERDAAVADMKNSRDCQCCKHYDVKWDEPCVHCDHDNNCFEWRGVKEE